MPLSTVSVCLPVGIVKMSVRKVPLADYIVLMSACSEHLLADIVPPWAGIMFLSASIVYVS